MKSNGDPNRYAVYIEETYLRAVEVVANTVEEAKAIAKSRYDNKMYERAPLKHISTTDHKDWAASQIEGCC